MLNTFSYYTSNPLQKSNNMEMMLYYTRLKSVSQMAHLSKMNKSFSLSNLTTGKDHVMNMDK